MISYYVFLKHITVHACLSHINASSCQSIALGNGFINNFSVHICMTYAINLALNINSIFSFISPVIVLKGWFIFFDFHHHVMNINEFISYLHIFVWSLSQNFLESVVVLNQLRQGSL